MSRLLIPSLLLYCATASSSQAADPLENTRAIDEQIKALDEASPVAAEARKLNEQMEDARTAANKAAEGAMQQIQKLTQTDAWKRYIEQRQAIEAKREQAWSVERRALGQEAAKIYAERHAELRSRAIADVPQAKAAGLDVLSYPRVEGSTSTQPLAVVIACRALGVPYEWIYPEPSGYRSPQPVIPEHLFMPVPGSAAMRFPQDEDDYELRLSASRVVAKPADNDTASGRKAVMINSLLATNSGTHESYAKLIDGKADLILAVRGPSADELKLAKDKGIQLDLKPIARDALVFMVNKKNKTTGLTRAEIKTLYREGIRRERPAQDGEFNTYIRDANSGSRELFDQLVLAGETLPEPDRRWHRKLYSNSMMGPYSQLTRDERGLAYSVYYYERFMAMSPLTRTIAVDGVEPTDETLSSGKYPLTTPVYAVRRANEPADSPATKLLNWLLSDEGQAVVRESGYVPIKNP